MTLSEYLKSTETTATALAEKLGVPPSTVTRWATGVRTPQIRYIPEIEALTGGKVKLVDFLTPATGTPCTSPTAGGDKTSPAF